MPSNQTPAIPQDMRDFQHDRAKPLAILHLDDLRELQRLARWARQNGCSLTS